MAKFIEIVVKQPTAAGWPSSARGTGKAGFVELPLKGWTQPQSALTPLRGLQALARPPMGSRPLRSGDVS